MHNKAAPLQSHYVYPQSDH